jgi:hypothetical protein
MYKSHASVGGEIVEDIPWQDDTDYDNGKYETGSDGTIAFSDWDDPGWEQQVINPDNEEFGGTKYFQGFVVDVCNHGSRVGPTLFYGMIASGAPPWITVLTYGFAK